MALTGAHSVREAVSRAADIPTAILRAELDRRQQGDAAPQQAQDEKPKCGSGNVGKYNTSIHVFALFLILVLSVAACAFPIIAKRFPKLPIPRHFLFLSRHFGTGVLIATAFVHLFPTAYISLTDPCLSWFWTHGYPAMPGLISMMAVFVLVGVEMFFAMKGAGHSHGSEFDTLGGENGHGGHGHSHGHRRLGSTDSWNQPRRSVSYKRRPPNLILPENSSSDNLIGGQSPALASEPSPLPPSPLRTSIDSEDEDLELGELRSQDQSLLNGHNPTKPRSKKRPTDQPSPSAASATPAQTPDQKALLQCLLLEAGILFHSIFIGMALSVTPVPAFYVLLIAISFHQTFEGLALGSRISALAFPPGSPKPWLMALAYGTTTPLGQAIGLAIHNLYDPASETGLISVGITNAISSGLLLFAGLVELLAADFLSEESFVALQGRRRFEACAAVVAGALLMALVGAWA